VMLFAGGRFNAAGRLHVGDAQKPAHPNLAGVAG